jgi:serine protease Do
LNLTTDRNGAVVVANVDPNAAAQRAGLRAGDQVLAVGDATVSAAADVTKAVDAAKQGGAKDVLLRVRSGQTTRFVAVPVG